MTNGSSLVTFYGIKWPLCVDVSLNTHTLTPFCHVIKPKNSAPHSDGLTVYD